MKRILWKRTDRAAALKTQMDNAVARLAASVQSIADDTSVIDKNKMLATSFAQFLDHCNGLTKRKTSPQAVADLHKIFGVAKNDWDLPGGGIDDPIGASGRRRRRSDDDDGDEAARLASEMDTDAGRDDREDENDDATDDEGVEKGMRTMESAQLTGLYKRHGFETIAKCNIEKPFLSEFEMTEVGKQEAAARGVSFAKLYESSITLRKAVEATKYAAFAKAGAGTLMPLMPTQTDSLQAARDVNSAEPDAYKLLVRMAEKMRAASAEPMTLAQAFSRTYTSPEARGLAEQERRDARSRLPTTGGRTAGGWGS